MHIEINKARNPEKPLVLDRAVGHCSTASWEHLQPGMAFRLGAGLTHAISLSAL